MEDGGITFVEIKKKRCPSAQGGTMNVTLTSKMFRERSIAEAAQAIGKAGGIVTFVRGRTMTVDVAGENVAEVGDVIDSYGCQWDMQ